ncbi:MAG: BamA/OMP85 family outer membrane protein [Armatimonadota bacterium]
MVEVVVRGLERLPASIVLDSIGVRAGELLSEERLRADVAAIVSTGWFADANVRVEPARDGVRVAFLVVENPVITDISVEGNTSIATGEILQALNVPVGQVLNIIRLRDGARAVEKLYEERGYVLARVADIGVVANGGARLRLRVAEGRIEAVEYKGLTKTQRFVLDRVTTVRPGRVFNINDLNRDLQRLVSLELFESVQARPRPGQAPDSVIVEIEVKEQRTQQARFGLGYSDRTGIVGLIEYSERNWKGRAQQITIRYERGLGERNIPSRTGPSASNFLLNFREPWIDAKQTALDVSVYENTTSEAEYTNNVITSQFNLNRLGSSIALTRPLDPQTSVSLRLRSERVLITPLPRDPTVPPCDTNPDDPLCPKPLPSFFSPGRTVALTLLGVRDRRDSRAAPTKGERLSASLDFGLPVIGGQFGFGKYLAEYTRYFPAGSGVLVGRGLLGVSHGTLPLQEQFIIGGPSTMRAYPVGFLRGSSVSLLNVEYRTPLGGLPLGGVARLLREFTGIVFVDAGSAPIAKNLLLGYGLGVSFNTAVGAIRIDYGLGSRGGQTWLTIGQPF